MPERLALRGDLWTDLHAHAHSLAQPLARVQAMLTEDDWNQARAASTRRPRTRNLPRMR
jgi:hypothetical protein